MERNQALQIVKKQLTEHRYQHTIGVMETAVKLANQFGADPKKAELAAIFHDYAKFRDKEEMKTIIQDQKLGDELLDFNSELWHAPVGAYLAEKEAGIQDPEILDAIRYHTSGRPNMTMLEKIVYLADYIEPGRHFPGVEDVRRTAETDLDNALLEAFQNTIMFLMIKKRKVFPLTFLTYNDLLTKGGK